jgi:PHD/YefM family antitoxin component YafN of YafNO toxin-antitoxin module
METTIHTISSRNFTRDVSAAKRAAAHGPVFVTDRGRPAFALLTIERYYQLDAHVQSQSLLEVMDGIACKDAVDFQPPRWDVGIQAAVLD